MAAGNIKIQANDTRIYTLTPEDGAGSNVDLTIPKDGGKLATNVYQSIAASRMLAGDVSVTNTITTQGMNTTLYTGNGSTRSVVTGIDMNTQWGNDASERFGGLVWTKSRSVANDHVLHDSLRGVTNRIYPNLTNTNTVASTGLTAFTSNGFTLGSDTGQNANTGTFVSWNFQTTHRVSGTTNHGQPYECHYNPFTGFTIVKYTGSGTAGHEIPHFLGRKLGFWLNKNLSAVAAWNAQYRENYNLNMDTTAEGAVSIMATGNNDTALILSTSILVNASTNQYILYGWANSYFDEANKLIGNYEIGTYTGTGVAGNKVTTRGKPAWVMTKRLDSTSNWNIFDNKRANDGHTLYPNTSNAEDTITDVIDFNADGFTCKGNYSDTNTSGGRHLYMVVYDTNANGGGTYYPRATDTSNLQLSDAQLMYSDGYANGTAKNTSEVLSGMTYPSVTYTAGYNYVKKTSGGGYSATAYEPKFGEVSATSDYYLDGKWYSSVGTPLGNITYLPIKVLADANGQIVSAESWKYPEVVTDGIATRSLKVTGEFDLGQTWKDVTASRASGVTYTNTTGKPIKVHVSGIASLNGNHLSILVDGIRANLSGIEVNNNYVGVYAEIPNGSVYLCQISAGTLTGMVWTELR